MNTHFLHPQPSAHSRFGGSVAGRILQCPGSVPRVAGVPPELRRTSIWAKRGTACHSGLALCLISDEPPRFDLLVGQTFDDYTLTGDDVDAIRLAYDYVDRLLRQPGVDFFVEERVVFPGVDGAFGTTDLVIRAGNVCYIIDFKFGSGVPVRAFYPDGDADVLNPQITFYAVAARQTLAAFLKGVETFTLVIVQPGAADDNGEIASVADGVTHAELDDFGRAFRNACAESLSPDARLNRGAHCRFCPAKPICPLHTGPLLDLAAFQMPAITLPKSRYLQMLADGLDLFDAVKEMRTAVHDQAKQALENGDTVPGWVLSAGRAERQWKHSDHTTIAALQALGLDHADIISEELRSPRQVEIRAKPKGVKVTPELIESKRSGSSLVRAENARFPVRGREQVLQEFSAALEVFRK